MRRSLTLVISISLLAAGIANAGSVTVSGTPPAVDSGDIDTLGEAASGGDATWSDRPNPGQSFTTGPLGGTLHGFTFLFNASGEPTKTYSFRVGTVSGTSFSTVYTETGQQTVANVANDYLTFEFDTPVALNANTTYGVDIVMTGSTSGWATGIPQVSYTASSVYSGGLRYTWDKTEVNTTTISTDSGKDRIFHIDIELPPQAGTIFIFQ